MAKIKFQDPYSMFISFKANGKQASLCAFIIKNTREGSTQSNLQAMKKRHLKSRSASVFEADAKKQTSFFKEAFHSLYYSNDTLLFEILTLDFNRKKLNSLFTALRDYLREKEIKVESVYICDEEYQRAGKYQSSLSKIGIRVKVEACPKTYLEFGEIANGLCDYALHPVQDLESLYEKFGSESLEKKEFFKKLSTASRSSYKKLVKKDPQLADSLIRNLYQAELDDSLFSVILSLLMEGYALEQILVHFDEKKKTSEVLKELEIELACIKEQKNFERNHFFSSKNPYSLKEYAVDITASMSELPFVYDLDLKSMQNRVLKRLEGKLHESFEKGINEKEVQEIDCFLYQQGDYLYMLSLKHMDYIRICFLVEEKKRQLQKEMGTIQKLQWESISQASDPIYEFIVKQLVEAKAGFLRLDNARESYAYLVKQASTNRNYHFYGCLHQAGRFKKQCLRQNKMVPLNLVKIINCPGIALCRMVVYGLDYYEKFDSRIEGHQKQGKQVIAKQIHDYIGKLAFQGFVPGIPVSSYFIHNQELTEEQIEVLGDPTLSIAITRRLASIFEKGYNSGSIYYIEQQAQSEFHFQRMLRLATLKYLFPTKSRQFIKSYLYTHPDLSDRALDLLCNPALSLKKIQLIALGLDKGIDEEELYYRLSDGMTVSKMEKVIDSITKKKLRYKVSENRLLSQTYEKDKIESLIDELACQIVSMDLKGQRFGVDAKTIESNKENIYVFAWQIFEDFINNLYDSAIENRLIQK